MKIDTKQRSTAPEIMDDFNLEGDLLRDALDKIAKINQLLGGNRVTISGVKDLLRGNPKQNVVRIVDIGCGNGDLLRALAEYGKKNKLNLMLKGIDANSFTINYARQLSLTYPNISYECNDIFDEHTAADECEIMICTLTLHHFKDDEIITLLKTYLKAATLGIVINDLHRSAIAYRLFEALCSVFGLNELSKTDGLISILRGFKKADLQSYSKQLQVTNCSIQWKWAFRYQWIIKTT